MTENKFGDKLEELDLSHEEIDRLTKCMKDDKFRDLLREYAEEISDPENRKRYEEEIALLEKDRGMDVKFINPKPGHVLKTSIDGNQKCFINICTNDNLGQPRSRPSMQGNTRGMQWSIPHSVSQSREDVDKAGSKCMVYDVVFHPDTYYLLKKNARFKKMIHDTALDAVERQFGVELDKINVRTPKMTFKGLPMSSVIRTPHPNGAPDTKDSSTMEDVDVRLHPPFPQNEVETTSMNGSASTNTVSSHVDKSAMKSLPFPNLKEEVKKAKQIKNRTIPGDTLRNDELEWGFIEPEYTIMHRGIFDIQNYHRTSPDVVHDTWPKELVINIDLPLLSAANCVNLEIFERHLHLDSIKPAKYKLDFELPYPVAENKGFAKFDKSRHRLTVTLEVLPAPPPPKLIPFTSPPLVKEVESDANEKVREHTDDDGCDEVCHNDDAKVEDSKSNEETSQTKQTVGIEEQSIKFNEATEATTETVMTESVLVKNKYSMKSKSGTSQKQPNFVEDGRRHYQEGTNWKDDDDFEGDVSSIRDKLTPLSKKSAFLIDMVMKYEGLIRRCPQYTFQQDEHYISFIIEVPHIFEESLWYAVYSNMLQFCCLSECLDDDMVNSVFQLWIEFDDGCTIDPQRSRVDVSGNNAVFCLRKTKSNYEWQIVKAGFDRDKLDIRRFSTTSNVCELYTLVYKHAVDVDASPLAVCKVVHEENDLLIIELEPKEGGVDENQANGANNAEKFKVEKKQTNQFDEMTNQRNGRTEEIDLQNDVECQKKVSFSEDVKKNTKRREESSSNDVDSDDECFVEEEWKSAAVGGVVTISGDDKEVIFDHVTKSAIQLSANSLIYELDNEV